MQLLQSHQEKIKKQKTKQRQNKNKKKHSTVDIWQDFEYGYDRSVIIFPPVVSFDN